MKDYMPREDAAFSEWSNVFINYAVTNAVLLGLTPAEVTAIQNLETQWQIDYNAAFQARMVAKSTTTAKNATRKQTEQYLRQLVRRIQANPAITDADRNAMNINIRDTEKTPSPIPAEVPMMLIDFSRRNVHLVHWGPNPGNEKQNGKPAGVMVCEIRYIVGPTPELIHVDTMAIAAIASSSPVMIDLADHKHELVTYMCRYLNTRMQPGSWSGIASALVA